MRHTLILAATLLVAATANADWVGQHRDASNNRYTPVTGVTDVRGTPALTTADPSVGTGASLILTGSTLYAVARTSGPDTCSIKAIDRATGNPLAGYTPAALDAGFSYSLSAPTYDAGDLYFGAGTTVYRLNGTTGTPVWSTVLSATNSDPAGDAQYAIVNSGVTVAAGRTFVQTYDSSFTAPFNKSQLVALNQTTGAVDWWVKSGGIGTQAPLYVANGGNPLVIVHVSQAGGGGMIAYDADAVTPTEVWNSATVAAPWSTTNLFWTDSVLVGGKIYGVTYNFSATNGRLVRVDAATGALEWSVASITADCPPVVVGSDIYLIGGAYGAPRLASYAVVDGALGYNVSAGMTNGVFRNYLTAANGALYVAASGEGLITYNPATGAIITRSADTGVSAPPVIEASGAVLNSSSSGLAIFDATSTVADWMEF